MEIAEILGAIVGMLALLAMLAYSLYEMHCANEAYIAKEHAQARFYATLVKKKNEE